jgi:integrase
VSAKVTVKRGSVSVPVYHTPGPRGDGWTVAFREPDGTRRRIFRASLVGAKQEAEVIATRLANVPDTLVGPEAREAGQAAQAAQAAGMTLLEAVQECCGAKAKLKGKATLDTAIDYFLARHVEEPAQVSLVQICEEFLRQQEQDGLNERYRVELLRQLRPFCADLACPPATLTARLIDDWLRASQKAHAWTGRTRNHCRAAISNMLNFAKRRGHLPRDWAEMPFVPKAVEEDGEIGIYSPEDLAKILAKPIEVDLLPLVVLGAFTGARPSEILRLGWEDFHWESGELFVGQGKVRTAGHRIAPLLPACAAWLHPVRKTSGRVTAFEFYAPALVGLVRSAGVASIQDGLRHSFITYRRAVTKDLAKVSGEVGTNPGTLTKRYCRPVKQADAEAWFSLRPS